MMKKFVAACFALMFILAVATGCPKKPVSVTGGSNDNETTTVTENGNAATEGGASGTTADVTAE